MALKFLYESLLRDAEGLGAAMEGVHDRSRNKNVHRRMRFLTSLDPLAAARAVAGLDPASTMVISIALKGIEETAAATKTLKGWLLQGVGHSRRPDIVFTKHMLLVTGSDRAAAANKPETVFLIPDHSRCEPFTTFTAATLLVSSQTLFSRYSVLVFSFDAHIFALPSVFLRSHYRLSLGGPSQKRS